MRDFGGIEGDGSGAEEAVCLERLEAGSTGVASGFFGHEIKPYLVRDEAN